MISRRTQFKVVALPCVWLVMVSIGSARTASSSVRWPAVPPADFSRLKPSDFADDELDLPYYLAHFHQLANSVVETGENRGFINLAVWRGAQDNQPYNARVMENILSLAFFYCTHRPWNQYYQSPAVRLRLEAALDFWCRHQSADGRFSEYGPRQWNLAATAFATKFMGQTLTLLRGGPPIDQELYRRTLKADRKAIYIVLTDPSLYKHGKNFTNQYTNVWAGGLAFLALQPDPELKLLLSRRIKENARIFQSPVGYFYEARGADWGYNLGTYHSNLWMAWHYLRGKDLGRLLVEEERRFVDWMSYNTVPEPDGSGFTLNRAIETRQRRPFLDRAVIRRSQEDQGQRLIASDVPLARAFLPTREEIQRDRIGRRRDLEQNWGPAKLEVGTFSAFSPYAFLHRGQISWYPTETQRKAANTLLPCRETRFNRQRMDHRERVVFTFVRQPGYYAVFNSGPHLTNQQRYGLGLIWQAEMGSLVQSQTGTSNAAWGTMLGQSQVVFEGDTLNVEFAINGTPLTPRFGNHDLPAGVLSIKYSFPDQGEKTLTFKDRQLEVEIQHSGSFREQIPLLLERGDTLETEPTEVRLVRRDKSLAITFDQAKVDTIETGLMVGPRRVVTLSLQSQNRLTYSLKVRQEAVLRG